MWKVKNSKTVLDLYSDIVQLAKNGVWKIHSGNNYNANIDKWIDLVFY
jgi:hypothetical protein